MAVNNRKGKYTFYDFPDYIIRITKKSTGKYNLKTEEDEFYSI